MSAGKTGVEPHGFKRLRKRRFWHRGEEGSDSCRHCLMPKWAHPIPYWAPARSLGDKRPASFEPAAQGDVPEGVCPACGYDIRPGSYHGSDCPYGHFRPRRKPRASSKELETTTPSGRVWDEDRQLWVDPSGEQGEEKRAIPDDYWRKVPCGHPPDPVAMYGDEGKPVCHCGVFLDPAATGAFPVPSEAPGPIVPCPNCGCYVAIPPATDPSKEEQIGDVLLDQANALALEDDHG